MAQGGGYWSRGRDASSGEEECKEEGGDKVRFVSNEEGNEAKEASNVEVWIECG